MFDVCVWDGCAVQEFLENELGQLDDLFFDGTNKDCAGSQYAAYTCHQRELCLSCNRTLYLWKGNKK